MRMKNSKMLCKNMPRWYQALPTPTRRPWKLNCAVRNCLTITQNWFLSKSRPGRNSNVCHPFIRNYPACNGHTASMCISWTNRSAKCEQMVGQLFCIRPCSTTQRAKNGNKRKLFHFEPGLASCRTWTFYGASAPCICIAFCAKIPV